MPVEVRGVTQIVFGELTSLSERRWVSLSERRSRRGGRFFFVVFILL
jgi:hypothetical protein